MNEIALRYAESLFSLAQDNDQVDAWSNEVKQLRKILLDEQDFIKLLASEFISLKEKYEIIDRTFSSFNVNIVSLIKVVVKNHRVSLLVTIFSSYLSLRNQYRGVKEGLIYSTVKLEEKSMKEISDAISKKEHCKVSLSPVIDPSLIGGVKVVINDHIYDGSIKHHLSQMQNELLRK